MTIACVLVSCLPLAALLAYVARHAVNLPWGEGLVLYVPNIVLPTYDGTLTISDVFKQVSDHRTVVSNLFIAASTLLTRYDVRVETWATVAEMLVVFVCSVLAFRADRPRHAVIALVPFSLLLFSISLTEIWRRQYSEQLLPLAFVSLGLLAIRTRAIGWTTLALTAALAFLSQYSTLSGIMAWFALPASMYLVGYRRPAYYVVWAGLFALSARLYFVGYAVSDEASARAGFADVTAFTLAVLGAGLSRSLAVSMTMSALGALVTAANLLRLRSRPAFGIRTTVWIGMITFAVLASVVTAIGRSGAFGAARVLDSHYARMSVYLWTAIFALAMLVLTDEQAPSPVLRWANVAIMVVATALYVPLNIDSWRSSIDSDGDPIGPTAANEECAWRNIVAGDRSCMRDPYWFFRDEAPTIYALAERRLATFAHDNPAAIMRMPFDYRHGDLVVVDAPLAVQHIAVVDAHGEPLPPGNLVRFISRSQRALLTVSSGTIVEADEPGLHTLTPATIGRRVWVIRASTHTTLGDALMNDLAPRSHQARVRPQWMVSYSDIHLFAP